MGYRKILDRSDDEFPAHAVDEASAQFYSLLWALFLEIHSF